MVKNLRLYFLGFTVLFTISVVSAQVTRESVENQYVRMSKLINDSSGARQVKQSDNLKAIKKREEALNFQQQARSHMEQRDYKTASEFLKQSAMSMFTAIRLATPSSVSGNKQKDDYARRRESVVALNEAFNRISDENNERENKEKTNRQVRNIVSSADSYLSNGKNIEARQELDKAYHLLKVSIEYIRAGQTLVRSLNFANAEEEYHYELDRNETHQMLVHLLVGEKRKTGYAKEKIISFVNEAKILRQQADAFASARNFEKAIELLEASTKQLVRSIRIAGVFIPG